MVRTILFTLSVLIPVLTLNWLFLEVVLPRNEDVLFFLPITAFIAGYYTAQTCYHFSIKRGWLVE